MLVYISLQTLLAAGTQGRLLPLPCSCYSPGGLSQGHSPALGIALVAWAKGKEILNPEQKRRTVGPWSRQLLGEVKVLENLFKNSSERVRRTQKVIRLQHKEKNILWNINHDLWIQKFYRWMEEDGDNWDLNQESESKKTEKICKGKKIMKKGLSKFLHRALRP